MKILAFAFSVPRDQWIAGLPVYIGWTRFGRRHLRNGAYVRCGRRAYAVCAVPKVRVI